MKTKEGWEFLRGTDGCWFPGNVTIGKSVVVEAVMSLVDKGSKDEQVFEFGVPRHDLKNVQKSELPPIPTNCKQWDDDGEGITLTVQMQALDSHNVIELSFYWNDKMFYSGMLTDLRRGDVELIKNFTQYAMNIREGDKSRNVNILKAEERRLRFTIDCEDDAQRVVGHFMSSLILLSYGDSGSALENFTGRESLLDESEPSVELATDLVISAFAAEDRVIVGCYYVGVMKNMFKRQSEVHILCKRPEKVIEELANTFSEENRWENGLVTEVNRPRSTRRPLIVKYCSMGMAGWIFGSFLGEVSALCSPIMNREESEAFWGPKGVVF